MSHALQEKVSDYIQDLISVAHIAKDDLDSRQFTRLLTGSRHITAVLGEQAAAWAPVFAEIVGDGSHGVMMEMLGALESLKLAVDMGLLGRIENLVTAETFGNLLEQADHLFGEGYLEAAGSLGRAVLEEHLRKWCGRRRLTLQRKNPTISDFNDALYTATPPEYDKTTMQHVTFLATIGNEAAHGKPVAKERIERLLHDVRRFLVQHPIP